MARKKPTIKDIARIANVSPTTISMALNNHSRISEKTRKRICAIAKELNYQPNYAARSLVSKRSHTIGVIITNIMNPFYPELAKGIEDVALKQGYNLILCNTNHDLKLEKYYISMLQSRGVDGIIFSSVEMKDPNIRPLVDDSFPFVLVNRTIHDQEIQKKVESVLLDNFTAAYMAMEHLCRLGYRRIGIISGPLKVSNAFERTQGAKKALKDYSVALDPSLLTECGFLGEAAYDATKKFLSMKRPPTAIFAENDYMALSVREAILDSGLKIPEDVALVGFDDIAATALNGVEITTISHKKYEMGSLAVKILLDKIENGNSTIINNIILEPELIIRNSCGYKLRGYRLEKIIRNKK